MQGAHHSWKEFYDYPPENLPFNSSPDKTLGAGEVSSFLSIPIKRNSRKIANSALSPLQNAIKQIMKPETKYQYPETDKDHKIVYLNFEYALLPHLVRDLKTQKWNLDDYYFDSQQIEVNIVFAWYESWFPERQVLTRCIQYEKASVLYNIAAIYSQLGTSERLWTADGLKNASVYFQKAAGVLTFLRDMLVTRFKVKIENSSDLHESTLSAVIALMLAQAAECYYEKAVHDAKTSSLTALLAIYNSDLYDVAVRHSRQSELKLHSKLPRIVVNQIKAKYNLYIAIAQFHTGPSASSDRAVGERLARLVSGKMYIAASIGYAEEVGGLLLESTLRHAKNLTTAHLCLDAANDEKIHDTPFDPRLLSPLRRPSEALVNPIDPKAEVLSHVAKCADVLQGLVSNSIQLAYKELEDQTSKVSTEGKSKMQALIDHYKKPIPDLEPLPEKFEEKFIETKMNGQKLLLLFEKLQSDERTISNIDLVNCLSKVSKYTDENLSEAVRILTSLMKAKPISGSELLELQNLQATVNQLREDQKDNLTRMEHCSISLATSNEFNSLDWSKDAFINLFSVISYSKNYGSELIQKWNNISKAVKSENDILQDLVAKCTACLKDYEGLQNSKFISQSGSYTEQSIDERKELLKRLTEKSEVLSKSMELAVKNIKDKEDETTLIMNSVVEIITQQQSIENFMETMLRAANYKKMLISTASSMLSTRLKSAGVLAVSSVKLQTNAREYMFKTKTSDPLILRLIKGDKEALLEKYQINENYTLKEMKLHFLDTDILPLEDASRDKYESFLNAVQQQSDPILLANLVNRRPVPIQEPIIDRRSVSFSSKNDKSAGFLGGFKDRFYQYILGGKHIAPIESHLSDQNPFLNTSSRKSSYASEYELEDSANIAKNVSNNQKSNSAEADYFTAVMKENAALRSQVFRMRSEFSRGESTRNLIDTPKKDRLETSFDAEGRRNTNDLKMWLQHQKMVSSPNASSRSSSSDPQLELQEKKIVKATVMAAAIAAGVTAQMQHKSRRHSMRDSGKTAITAHQGGIVSKLGRDDSGVKVNDSSVPTEKFAKRTESFIKPNLFRMKQENDRLAKALGLV